MIMNVHRFCLSIVCLLTWGHDWISFGYTGSQFGNIGCRFRQLFRILAMSSQKNERGFFELARLKIAEQLGSDF